MPISLQCRCGQKLEVNDDLAGRKVRCPKCSFILSVAKPDIEAEHGAADVSVAGTPSDADKELDWHKPDSPASTALTDRPPHRAPAPVKKRRPASKRQRKKESRRRIVGVSINAEVATGLVMIVVAIAWFIGGLLWLHRVFFYPPILAILGIAAIIKGFTPE